MTSLLRSAGGLEQCVPNTESHARVILSVVVRRESSQGDSNASNEHAEDSLKTPLDGLLSKPREPATRGVYEIARCGTRLTAMGTK